MDIQNWMQKLKVWRVVSFVSCVVGLLFFGLSSCSNDLFRKWTTWKILVYIFVSFIICLGVLLVKAPQGGSSSPSLKFHSAFLGLLTTSVYSYFWDKEVKVKPDAFSLLSTAAFAIMSLGLSRIGCFGFEVDLMSFFISMLIVQFMKIKGWLFIIGGCFGYFLVFLCNNLISPRRIGLDIQNWMQKTEVRRVVRLVSCVVALLCFALSSSSTDFVGKWTASNILVYIFTSLLICFGISLVVEEEAASYSRWIDSLMLLTPFVCYNYFDKVVKVKPDAFGLLSSAAFATTYSWIPRVSYFGVGVNVMYIFIGVLTVQLMKIEVWLVIVGGSFGYFLLVLRSILSFPLGIGLDTRLPSDQNHLVIDIGPN